MIIGNYDYVYLVRLSTVKDVVWICLLWLSENIIDYLWILLVLIVMFYWDDC
jgi:hypothetical protein